MNKERKRELLKWLGINVAVALTVPFFFASENYFSLAGWAQLWDDMLYSFMMALGISSAVGINERILDRHFPWLEKPTARFFMEILGVSFFAFTASFLMNILFFAMLGRMDLDNIPWQRLLNNTWVPLIIGYVITTFFISRGFLSLAKAEAVRAERLQTEKYRSEVRILKDQLNPHFLFNALNVLTNLVYEDADQSADYIRKLSRFYRYVLEVQNEDLVELDRELGFTRDYLILQQERFGEKALQFLIRTGDGHAYKLPPLALQLLVENAIKHNKCSAEEPLSITIEQEGPNLKVRNNLQERQHEAEALGIGTSNLKRRYELLKMPAPQFMANQKEYVVQLPLKKSDESINH